jgi:3-hydroxyacyl-CoA dehydrogenase
MGMHFFSPANVMKLVENIQCKHTSPETISAVTAHTKKISKVGVLVGNCDGFVGNRMVAPYTGEACFLLEEGASVQDVDGAIVDLGMAIGPFTMGDIAGNDIGYLIRKEKGWVEGGAGDMRYTDLPDTLVTKFGRIGQKAGKGWYDYDPNVGKGRIGLASEEVEAWLEGERGDCKDWNEKDLVERSLFPLVNEGFKILEEGICDRPEHIDIIYIYGYGWPVWRGGPMWWADQQVGLEHVLEMTTKYHEKYQNDWWKPSQLLVDLVADKKGVYEWANEKAKARSKL